MKNIYIGNLALGMSPASLRALFEPHGTIRSLKLMTHRETGVSRGFAFIEMADAEAERAIAALNGRLIDGQQIDVHEGRPKLHVKRALPKHRVPR